MNPLRQLMMVLALLVGAAFQASAQTPHPDLPGVLSTLRSFRAALVAGDVPTVEKLLARDASILEAGELESRKAYLEHHLQEDIKFARAVPSQHSEPSVVIAADVAWATSTSTTKGSFQSKPISLVGAELMVLSREPSGAWVIRAIHWSSRKAK